MTHPTRGTCGDTACEFHGFCHDGCGQRTRIADQWDYSRDIARDMPFIYRNGHSPVQRANTVGAWVHSIGTQHKSDIPIERVRSMAEWLVERYGGPTNAARAMGVPRRTFEGWLTPERQGIRPTSARRLVDFVLANRTAVDPFAEYEPRRFPTAWERDRSRREEIARERAKYRKQRVKREAS